MDLTALLVSLAPWVGIIGGVIAFTTRFVRLETQLGSVTNWKSILEGEHKVLEFAKKELEMKLNELEKRVENNDTRFNRVDGRLFEIEKILQKISIKLGVDE